MNFNHPEKDSWKLVLATGCVIETRSAEHTERLASVAPDFILVTEAGQCSPSIRESLLGRALEKDATIVYSGTIEDQDNHSRYSWYETLAVQWAAEAQRDTPEGMAVPAYR